MGGQLKSFPWWVVIIVGFLVISTSKQETQSVENPVYYYDDICSSRPSFTYDGLSFKGCTQTYNYYSSTYSSIIKADNNGINLSAPMYSVYFIEPPKGLKSIITLEKDIRGYDSFKIVSNYSGSMGCPRQDPYCYGEYGLLIEAYNSMEGIATPIYDAKITNGAIGTSISTTKLYNVTCTFLTTDKIYCEDSQRIVTYTSPSFDTTRPVYIRMSTIGYAHYANIISDYQYKTILFTKLVLGDSSGNGFIENNELIDFISLWQGNGATSDDLLDVINTWVNSP
jgi:hypothetical protein